MPRFARHRKCSESYDQVRTCRCLPGIGTLQRAAQSERAARHALLGYVAKAIFYPIGYGCGAFGPYSLYINEDISSFLRAVLREYKERMEPKSISSCEFSLRG